MKRIIVIIMFGLFCIGAVQAQTQWYKATEFAIKFQGYEWTDWQSVNINIKFDLSEDIIVVYSKDTQVYKVLEQVASPRDSGGQQVKFTVIDQDFDRGYLRLRVENSGNSQIYVDFSDVSWVYNVTRIK